MNIFLIDDSISMIFAFQSAINSIADCQIHSFQYPLNALEKLEGMVPGLVLVDCEMPAMNGIEVIKAIRANDRTATVPVIMINSTIDKHIKPAADLNRKFEDPMARINRREEEIIWRLSKAIGIRHGDTGTRMHGRSTPLSRKPSTPAESTSIPPAWPHSAAVGRRSGRHFLHLKDPMTRPSPNSTSGKQHEN